MSIISENRPIIRSVSDMNTGGNVQRVKEKKADYRFVSSIIYD